MNTNYNISNNAHTPQINIHEKSEAEESTVPTNTIIMQFCEEDEYLVLEGESLVGEEDIQQKKIQLSSISGGDILIDNWEVMPGINTLYMQLFHKYIVSENAHYQAEHVGIALNAKEQPSCPIINLPGVPLIAEAINIRNSNNNSDQQSITMRYHNLNEFPIGKSTFVIRAKNPEIAKLISQNAVQFANKNNQWSIALKDPDVSSLKKVQYIYKSHSSQKKLKSRSLKLIKLVIERVRTNQETALLQKMSCVGFAAHMINLAVLEWAWDKSSLNKGLSLSDYIKKKDALSIKDLADSIYNIVHEDLIQNAPISLNHQAITPAHLLSYLETHSDQWNSFYVGHNIGIESKLIASNPNNLLKPTVINLKEDIYEKIPAILKPTIFFDDQAKMEYENNFKKKFISYEVFLSTLRALDVVQSNGNIDVERLCSLPVTMTMFTLIKAMLVDVSDLVYYYDHIDLHEFEKFCDAFRLNVSAARVSTTEINELAELPHELHEKILQVERKVIDNDKSIDEPTKWTRLIFNRERTWALKSKKIKKISHKLLISGAVTAPLIPLSLALLSTGAVLKKMAVDYENYNTDITNKHNIVENYFKSNCHVSVKLEGCEENIVPFIYYKRKDNFMILVKLNKDKKDEGCWSVDVPAATQFEHQFVLFNVVSKKIVAKQKADNKPIDITELEQVNGKYQIPRQVIMVKNQS